MSGTPATDVRIRPARTEEAAAITALARRSKAAWGYPPDFLARVRDDMTIGAADIEQDRVDVLASGERILGFCRLRRRGDHAELEDLFIEPDAMGAGHGRRLFEHAVTVARGWGTVALELDSDPHAEGFYLARGMRRVGETPSTRIEGRRLPRLRLDLG